MNFLYALLIFTGNGHSQVIDMKDLPTCIREAEKIKRVTRDLTVCISKT